MTEANQETWFTQYEGAMESKLNLTEQLEHGWRHRTAVMGLKAQKTQHGFTNSYGGRCSSMSCFEL